MTAQTYKYTINGLVAVGVAAVLLHDRLGGYAWIASVAVGLCATAAAAAYFWLHWTPHDSQQTESADAPPVPYVGHQDVATWVPSKYDARKIGWLLAEFEKQSWSVSGTLCVHPPASRDAKLHIVIRDGKTVHLIPSFDGLRGVTEEKQPLSKPEFVAPRRVRIAR